MPVIPTPQLIKNGAIVTNGITVDILIITGNIAQGEFLAGPLAGGNGPPTFRSIAASDLPLANSNTAGIVSAGNNISINNGTISADIGTLNNSSLNYGFINNSTITNSTFFDTTSVINNTGTNQGIINFNVNNAAVLFIQNNTDQPNYITLTGSLSAGGSIKIKDCFGVAEAYPLFIQANNFMIEGQAQLISQTAFECLELESDGNNYYITSSRSVLESLIGSPALTDQNNLPLTDQNGNVIGGHIETLFYSSNSNLNYITDNSNLVLTDQNNLPVTL